MLHHLLHGGLLPEGEFHEKICQYLVVREYNIRYVVALPRELCTHLSSPFHILSGLQNFRLYPGAGPRIDIEISGFTLMLGAGIMRCM